MACGAGFLGGYMANRFVPAPALTDTGPADARQPELPATARPPVEEPQSPPESQNMPEPQTPPESQSPSEPETGPGTIPDPDLDPDPVTGGSVPENATGNRTKTASEVAAAVRDSVVEIKTEIVTDSGWGGTRIAEGAGSGVIVSADGTIITNHHVISGAATITVRLASGREFEARLIGTDPITDIAVLRISASGLTPAVFGDSSRLVVGESALAVGNPLGELGGTVTGGIISALDRDMVVDGQIMTLLQTDAAVNPGNSGGGLFNMNAELIGVVVAKSSGLDIEGLGFAIPAKTAEAVMRDIITHGFVRGRVDARMELVDIQTTQAARMYRVNQLGLYVLNSYNELFVRGDRIIAVGDREISNQIGYDAELKRYKVGDTVSITVVRNGQNHMFDITLTEWTP